MSACIISKLLKEQPSLLEEAIYAI